MLQRLLVCWGILVLLCAWHPPRPGEPYTREVIGVQRIVTDMSLAGVKVDVRWASCGFVNAFYSRGVFPSFGSIFWPGDIVLCNEITQIDPAMARFMVAHEMAHAIIEQRQIPYTGSDETAADQLAMAYLALAGRTEDLVKVANYFLHAPGDEIPWDAHPSNKRRAIQAACFAAASLNQALDLCTGTELKRAIWTWEQLLHVSLQERVVLTSQHDGPGAGH